MNYDFINKFLLSNFTKFFPKTLNRKIFRKYKVFFVPTSLSSLPDNYYPITTNYNSQKKLVYQFSKNKKLINGTTKQNLDIFLSDIYKNKSFSFFDVGGDNIDLYLFLNFKLNINKYYISNFPELISIFNKLKLKFKLKNFYPIKNIKFKNVDFVYFGSCIQYLKNYKSYIKIILKKKPKYILFSGTSFYYDELKKDTFVVKQTNILANNIFLYFFNYRNFVKFLNNNGYKLISSKKNQTAKINYKNFKPLINKINYLDLMFEKK